MKIKWKRWKGPTIHEREMIILLCCLLHFVRRNKRAGWRKKRRPTDWMEAKIEKDRDLNKNINQQQRQQQRARKEYVNQQRSLSI